MRAFAILAVAVYLLLGLTAVAAPGLYYDESIFVWASYPDATRGGAAFTEIAGRPVCWMLSSYVGPLKGWLYRPVFEVFGTSAAAVRAPAVVLGALTLLLLWLLARRVASEQVATWAVALTALDPTFVWTSRLDWGPVVLQRLFLVGGCLLAVKWRDSRRSGWLAAAAFVFGLGVFDKASFLWLLAALAVALGATCPRPLPAPGPRQLAAAAAAFLTGSLGWWLYQLQPAESSFDLGVETHAVHWQAKASMLLATLDGTALEGWATNVCGGVIGASWLPWALACAALSWPWLRKQPHARVTAFSGVFCAAAWLVMGAVESAGSVHHFALVYPFPQLGLAAALAAAPARRLALAAGVLVCATGVRAAGGLLLQAVECGGTRYWSTAIYELAAELERRRPAQVSIPEWGIAAPLRLLSADRLPTKEQPLEGAQPEGAVAVRYYSADPLPGYVLVEAIADRGGPVFEIFEAR